MRNAVSSTLARPPPTPYEQGAKVGLDLLVLIITRLKIQVDKVTARKVDSTIVRNEEAWDQNMDGSGAMDGSAKSRNWEYTKVIKECAPVPATSLLFPLLSFSFPANPQTRLALPPAAAAPP